MLVVAHFNFDVMLNYSAQRRCSSANARHRYARIPVGPGNGMSVLLKTVTACLHPWRHFVPAVQCKMWWDGTPQISSELCYNLAVPCAQILTDP